MTTKPDPEETRGTEQSPPAQGGTSGRSNSRKGAKPPVSAAASGGRGKQSKPKTNKSQKAAVESSGHSKAKRQRTARKTPKQATDETPSVSPKPQLRLLTKFRQEIAPALVQEFGYASPMQVPRLSKIVLNIGLGEALENAKAIESATRDLSIISGQRPVTTRARKSIAGFKVRQGMIVGLTVTLRGRRMYEFFDRLISSSLPRIRDFRGISSEAFDGRGNYSLGIREQVIFPEIDYNTIDRIRGLQIAIVTTARTDREGFKLLEMFGVPFARTETGATAA